METYLSVLFDGDKVNSVVMLGGGTARAEVIADNESKWLPMLGVVWLLVYTSN